MVECCGVFTLVCYGGETEKNKMKKKTLKVGIEHGNSGCCGKGCC